MEVNSWISGLPKGGAALSWVIMLASAALAVSPLGRMVFTLAGKAAEKLAKNTAAAILTVAIFALCVSGAISILVDFPEPAVHDEFSYVLAGETFARGRLTNPKHSLWEFFETVYVIHDPTYQSKYPPGQGLMLAAGIALSGEPILGVWLGTALACGALTWMLLAWLPRKWALAGGFLAALHPVMLQWGATFWGGAVAMTGGALLLGAMRRLWDRPGFWDGIVLGAGTLLLANSRPFEGLLLCLAVGVALLLWMLRRRNAAWPVVAAMALVLVPGFVWMGYYNWRVTAHPLLTPYQRHDQIYGRTPHFIWQNLRPPRTYSALDLTLQYEKWEVEHWQRQQSLVGWGKEIARKAFRLLRGFFQPLALLIPLLILPSVLRQDRWMQLAGAFLLFFFLAIGGITWNELLHYAAPIAPLGLVLLVACMSEMSRRGRLWNLAVRAVLALFLFSIWPTYRFIDESQRSGPQYTRAKIVNTIRNTYPGEKHLFVIRYLPGEYDHVVEWIYNGADIDGQDFVWARDLGPQRLPALLSYYKDRRPWLLEIGPRTVTPQPLGWKLANPAATPESLRSSAPSRPPA